MMQTNKKRELKLEIAFGGKLPVQLRGINMV